MLLARRACLVSGAMWLVSRTIQLLAPIAALAQDHQQPDNPDKRQESKKDQPADIPEEPVYDLGPGVTPPRVTHQVRPERGEGFRLSGKVVISLIVSSTGEPGKLNVVQGIDKDLDQRAVAALRQWRFAPGRKDGKPVAVRVTVEMRFNDL